MKISEEDRPDSSSRGDMPLVVAIDDDPAVLSALARLLGGEPYEFIPTSDPEEALELVRTRPVSVMMADYRMPVLSGSGLLQLVKAASPSTYRLMLTAYPRSTWVLRAHEMGAIERVVEKPWDNDELRGLIRSQLFGDDASGDL